MDTFNQRVILLSDIEYPPTLNIYSSQSGFMQIRDITEVEAGMLCNKQVSLAKVKLYYSKKEKSYYIARDVFESYQAYYQGLITRIQQPNNYSDNPLDEEEDANNEMKSKRKFREYSKLRAYGYNASGEASSMHARHALLMYLMYYRLMGKNEISEQLITHLKMRSIRNPYAAAIWESDLNFVSVFSLEKIEPCFSYLEEHAAEWKYHITPLNNAFLSQYSRIS